MKHLNKKKAVILGLLALSISTGVLGQESEKLIEENKTKLSVEIDPLTFALKGYGVHFRIKPKNSDHLLFGAGTYAMDFPKVLVNLNKNNRDLGWSTRLRQGYGLFTEYHFTEVNRKWYVGAQVAFQEYAIEKEDAISNSKFSNLLFMGLGGYTLQPFKFGLYFKFWGGLGYQTKIAGDNFIEGNEYDVSPMLLFGALHIGYEF